MIRTFLFTSQETVSTQRKVLTTIRSRIFSEEKILIFGTKTTIQRLCETDRVCIDSTFKSAPALFSQLYTFHCKILDKSFQIIFIFWPNKSSETYWFRKLSQSPKIFNWNSIQARSWSISKDQWSPFWKSNSEITLELEDVIFISLNRYGERYLII